MGGTWTSDRGQRNKSTTFLGLAVKVGLLLFRKQASGQEGRRAQGVHEDLPVDQEGVSSAAPTQASGDSCVRRLACAFQVARALGGGIER